MPAVQTSLARSRNSTPKARPRTRDRHTLREPEPFTFAGSMILRAAINATPIAAGELIKSDNSKRKAYMNGRNSFPAIFFEMILVNSH